MLWIGWTPIYHYLSKSTASDCHCLEATHANEVFSFGELKTITIYYKKVGTNFTERYPLTEKRVHKHITAKRIPLKLTQHSISAHLESMQLQSQEEGRDLTGEAGWH